MNPYEPGQSSPEPSPASSPQIGFSENGPATLAANAFTAGMVRFALINGLVVVGVVLAVAGAGNEPAKEMPFLFFLGAAVWISCVVVSFVLPGILRGKTPAIEQGQALADAIASVDRKEPLPKVVHPAIASYMTEKIVAGALWEGPAIVNLIFWYLSKSSIHLVFVAFSLVLLVVTFPTLGQLRNFLVERIRGEG